MTSSNTVTLKDILKITTSKQKSHKGLIILFTYLIHVNLNRTF